eukprot:3920489-Rhodomonas_salina.4
MRNQGRARSRVRMLRAEVQDIAGAPRQNRTGHAHLISLLQPIELVEPAVARAVLDFPGPRRAYRV